MTLEEKLQSLLPARLIAEVSLQDEGIQTALVTLRTTAHQRIEQTSPDDGDTRENLYHFLQALTAVEQELARMIRDHRVEQTRQERAANAPKRGINL